MVVTNTFYLTAESYRQWLEANPTAVSVDANNVQKSPLVIRSWSGEGSDKTAYPVYLTLQVESVAGSSTEVLYTYKSASKVSEYTYTLPSDKYATSNRITVSAYDDAARTQTVGTVQLSILADNPVPYPRSEDWSKDLVLKNGEYLKQGDMLYMWTSRVPGNTTTDPKTWIQNNPTSKLWSVYPYNTLLAGQILLFEFALLGKAVFKDEYMMSQYGVDSNGASTNDYRQFDSGNFTPNLLMDFLTGKFKSKDAEVEGKITAKEGEIGGFNIGTSSLSCSNKTASIDVEYSGGRFLHVNSGQYLAMIDVRSDDTMHAIRVQAYGSKNGINVVCNGTGLAIESYGDVRMIARQNSGEKIEINGLCVNVRNMSSGGSMYSSDDLVTFSNTSSINVFLPDEASCKGKIIYIKRLTGALVTLNGNIIAHSSSSTMSSYQPDQSTYMLISNGSNWIMHRSG